MDIITAVKWCKIQLALIDLAIDCAKCTLISMQMHSLSSLNTWHYHPVINQSWIRTGAEAAQRHQRKKKRFRWTPKTISAPITHSTSTLAIPQSHHINLVSNNFFPLNFPFPSGWHLAVNLLLHQIEKKLAASNINNSEAQPMRMQPKVTDWK